MSNNAKTTIASLLFGVLLIGVMVGWTPLINYLYGVKPKPPLPPLPKQEPVLMVMGGMASGVKEVRDLPPDRSPRNAPDKEPEPKEPDPKEPPKAEAQPVERGELIAMGRGERPYHLQLLLNTEGGSVQQVILSDFLEASREGLEVKAEGQPPKLLHLVPGQKIKHTTTIKEQTEYDKTIPELHVGPIEPNPAFPLDTPSFLLFHYERQGDERPIETLGKKKWTWLKDQGNLDPNADEQKVVFQTELGDPYNLQITKTFTLKRTEYHIGLKLDFKRLAGKTGWDQFRYQLTGAHGLPIEGEWYTSTYRNAMMGRCEVNVADKSASTSREFADARSIRTTEGSERWKRGDEERIDYAAVATQYFASAIAVDDQQANRNFLEYVRATPADKHPPPKPPERGRPVEYFDFLDDITVRAISEPFNPDDVSHQLMLYHGPVKVRLLKEMPSSKAVDDALVDRYLVNLHLNTMTDAPASAVGRFANRFFWVDLLVSITNVLHSLLYYLNQVIPSHGICILVVTVMVRGMLFPFSRHKTAKAQWVQAQMAKHQPEIKKLKEKFAGDPMRQHQEIQQYLKDRGINQLAAMGGCFFMLLQMPVFMGLYYALQESIIFRLAPFLWIRNLAAPDMTVYWGEQIPYLGDPSYLGGTIFLGPFFNVLPVVAVVFTLYQQHKTMPKSDDPEVQKQQQMMKFMMIIMAVFFYKFAAGMCLYYIASSIWGMSERRLLPKLPDGPSGVGPGSSGPNDDFSAKREVVPEQPPGWWGRKKTAWKSKWDEILEQAQKQQEYRRDPSSQPPDKGGGKKKKKRK